MGTKSGEKNTTCSSIYFVIVYYYVYIIYIYIYISENSFSLFSLFFVFFSFFIYSEQIERGLERRSTAGFKALE